MLVEVKHLRGTTTCPREGLGKAGAMRLAAGGELVCLPTRRAGWQMGSSLGPPRDPQAQTPFPSPPVARRMDFLSGARAPPGLRRATFCAKGQCQQRADISSPPQPESGSRAWQVFGGSRMRFLVVCGMHKRRVGQAEKDGMSTRVAAREQPEAPRLQFSSWGSHNILKFPAWNDSMKGPHPVLSRKKWRLCMAVGLV